MVYRPTRDLGRGVWLREGTGDESVWEDTFKHRYHVVDVVPKPATVLDLGANIGLTAAHYKTIWPAASVVAVEMDSENARMARLNSPDVDVVWGAVAPRSGDITYDSRAPSYSYAVSHDGDTKAPCFAIDGLIIDMFDRHVDFVKMDIEGMEWNLLAEPGWAAMVDAVLIEFHPYGESPNPRLTEKATRLLVAAGFDVRSHTVHPRSVYGSKQDHEKEEVSSVEEERRAGLLHPDERAS